VRRLSPSSRTNTHIGASIFEWKQKWTAFVVECGWSRVFSVRPARRVRAVSTPHSREKLLSPSFVRRSSTASPSNRRDASTSAPPRRVASTTSARNDARRRRYIACSGAWPAVARRYQRSSTPLDTTLEHVAQGGRRLRLQEESRLRINDVRMPRCPKVYTRCCGLPQSRTRAPFMLAQSLAPYLQRPRA
jgi:hypothetical protein